VAWAGLLPFWGLPGSSLSLQVGASEVVEVAAPESAPPRQGAFGWLQAEALSWDPWLRPANGYGAGKLVFWSQTPGKAFCADRLARAPNLAGDHSGKIVAVVQSALKPTPRVVWVSKDAAPRGAGAQARRDADSATNPSLIKQRREWLRSHRRTRCDPAMTGNGSARRRRMAGFDGTGRAGPGAERRLGIGRSNLGRRQEPRPVSAILERLRRTRLLWPWSPGCRRRKPAAVLEGVSADNRAKPMPIYQPLRSFASALEPCRSGVPQLGLIVVAIVLRAGSSDLVVAHEARPGLCAGQAWRDLLVDGRGWAGLAAAAWASGRQLRRPGCCRCADGTGPCHRAGRLVAAGQLIRCAGFGGYARWPPAAWRPLNGMLARLLSGLSVVDIGHGYGAAMAAVRISEVLQLRIGGKKSSDLSTVPFAFGCQSLRSARDRSPRDARSDETFAQAFRRWLTVLTGRPGLRLADQQGCGDE